MDGWSPEWSLMICFDVCFDAAMLQDLFCSGACFVASDERLELIQ